LQEERRAVKQALLSLDHFPAGMELFPASNDDQWALIKGVIDDSDYYVLVIGGRYGTTSDTGMSYTEMEYDYALSLKIPILSFVHKNPAGIPSGKTDQNDALRERLKAFKEKVTKSKVVKFWTSADELQAQVILSISAETKRNTQVGWVRANKSTNPEVLEAVRQENARLRQELETIKVGPPDDVQKFAQGDDKIKISATYELSESSQRYGHDFKMTWNQVLREIGPLMLDEAGEQQIRDRLSAEMALYTSAKFPAGSELVQISNESFDTIKVQLMSLGLIMRSQRKRLPSDRQQYWALTPHGESELMKLRAVLKEN
jgi:hypothetical protein